MTHNIRNISHCDWFQRVRIARIHCWRLVGG